MARERDKYLFTGGKKMGVQSLVLSWSEAAVSSLPHGLLCMPLTTGQLTFSKSAREEPVRSVDTSVLYVYSQLYNLLTALCWVEYITGPVSLL